MPQVTLSPRAARACRDYSLDSCLAAFALHQQGYGARGVSYEGPSNIRTTRQADAAINAGREYVVFTTGSEQTDAAELRKSLHQHESAIAQALSAGRAHSYSRSHRTVFEYSLALALNPQQ